MVFALRTTTTFRQPESKKTANDAHRWRRNATGKEETKPQQEVKSLS